jgi:hypothetical protein
MKNINLWMLVAILLFCGAINVQAQTKQGEWFSSSSIGAG